MAVVPMRTERFGDIDYTERKQWEDRNREWSYFSATQRTTRISGNHQKLEEASKDSSWHLERVWHC